MRNVIAIVVGWIAGSAVNMAIVMLGSSLVGLPAGVDPTDPESIAASIDKFQTRHFVAPFLAHALGTLVGASVAVRVGVNLPLCAYLVGGLFLLGGAVNLLLIPSPQWFAALDVVGAYLPMAWLGLMLSSRMRSDREAPMDRR
jgi:hypothetical protein